MRPVARLLVCDGAPQFTWITEELGLCWVHEGRHYKKLFPYVAQHQKLLEDFLGDFWDFYRELLAYRQQPTPGERKRLERRFDALFATKTGYWALDERIGLTRAKKTSLLMVLVATRKIPLPTTTRRNWTQDSGCESGRSVLGLGWLREPGRGTPSCPWLGPPGSWE